MPKAGSLRTHREQGCGHLAHPNLLGLALPQGLPEGQAGVRPIQGWLPGLLGHAETDSGDADGPPNVEDRQGVAKPLAELPDDILDGNLDIPEGDVPVFNPAAALELASLANLHPRSGHVEDEGGRHSILSTVPSAHRSPGRFAIPLSTSHRYARDEGDEAGDRSVRAPQFLAVDDEIAAGRVQHRLRLDVRGIGSGERFGQRESGDVFPSHARQKREGPGWDSPSRRASWKCMEAKSGW
jgi:hypothetical protein